MTDLISIFTLLGGLLFFSLLAEWFFEKTKVPDVLLLIGIGVLIGPVMGLVSPDVFAPVSVFFITFALLFLAFEGALAFDIRRVQKTVPGAIELSIFNIILSVAISLPIGVFIGLSWEASVLLGLILGGTAGEVVSKLLGIHQGEPATATLLSLEAAISDVLAVVGVVVFASVVSIIGISASDIASQVLSTFAVALLIGISLGFVWTRVLIHSATTHAYVLTVAMMLLVYGAAEFSKSSGPLAVVAFALVLGNSRRLLALLKGGSGETVVTTEARTFYTELAFLVRTFFFIYTGIIASFASPMLLLVGAGIMMLLLVFRPVVVRVTNLSFLPPKDVKFVNVVVPRGLAAVVLAQVAMRYPIRGVVVLPTIVLSVVVVSLLLTALFTFLSTSKKKRRRKK